VIDRFKKTWRGASAWFGQRPKLKRALGVIGIALAGLYVLYLVAANVVLATPLLRSKLNEEPNITLEYASAWSLLPGVVHVRDFRLVLDERAVQMELRFDEVSVRIALPKLLRRTFHAKRVLGHGSALRVRNKVENPDAHRRRLAAYPSIEGLPDPPRLTDLSPAGRSDTWTIILDDVDSELRELWLLEYRFAGSAHARGGFHFHPTHSFELYDSSLELEQGRLGFGAKQPVLEIEGGSVQAQIGKHDVMKTRGPQVLDQASATIRLRSQLKSVDFMNIYSARGSKFSWSGGAGRLELDLRFDGGVLQTPSHVSYATDALTLSHEKATVRADAELALLAKHDDELSWQLVSKQATLGHEERKSTQGTIDALRARLEPQGRKLAKLFALAGTELTARLDVRDLTWFKAFAPKMPLRGGQAKGQLDLRNRSSERFTGAFDLKFNDLHWSSSGQSFRMRGELKGKPLEQTSEPRSGFRDVSLHVAHLLIQEHGEEHEKDETGAWWFTVVADRVNWTPSDPSRLSATWQLGGGSVEPLMPALVESGLVRTAADAIIDFDETRGTIELRTASEELSLRVPKISSGDLTVRGSLRRSNGTTNGRFLVHSPLANVGVSIRRGQVETKPLVSDEWLEQR